MFSILILTKDEEVNLPDCLRSVAWCDDVVVLDSLSTDRTREIALAGGARVFERPFDDFGAQRNHALDYIRFKHPWVFHLDADERFNEELRLECERVIGLDERSAYFVPNRIIFMGRWIRRCTRFPYPQVRLLKIGEVRYVKFGHGQREGHAARGVGHIAISYDHYNFSKGLADWIDKHNHYSSSEAATLLQTRSIPVDWRGMVSCDGMRRRRALKRIHARIPGRWMIKFVYLYVIRLGFLEGYPGLVYCVLQGLYDFLITTKALELQSLTQDHSKKRQ